MDNLKIYMAGKMAGLQYIEMNEWRTELKSKLLEAGECAGVNLKVVNPVDYYNFNEVRYQNEREVEEYDLYHVVNSDIVVVNLEGLDSSIGTIIELHDARYHNKIPVIAFGREELYDNLHPWIRNDITRVERDINDVVEYILDFYMR